jgi:hypothetical protein
MQTLVTIMYDFSHDLDVHIDMAADTMTNNREIV